MKNMWKSMKLTIVFCVIFAIGYVGVLWVLAQVATPGKGKVSMLTLDGKTVGADLVGQSFVSDVYFWGRPSAAGYDASRSSGSNQGPTSKEYLKEVEARVDSFLVHHPYLSRKDVPVEMVTASGSGLDPDITPASAYIQVERIAKARGLKEPDVRAVVDKLVERPVFDLFGPEKVDVLRLNIAMDETFGKR